MSYRVDRNDAENNTAVASARSDKKNVYERLSQLLYAAVYYDFQAFDATATRVGRNLRHWPRGRHIGTSTTPATGYVDDDQVRIVAMETPDSPDTVSSRSARVL